MERRFCEVCGVVTRRGADGVCLGMDGEGGAGHAGGLSLAPAEGDGARPVIVLGPWK